MNRKLTKGLKGTKGTDRKKAIKEADKWFSLYIRARDNNKCYCGKEAVNPQCGHLISRASYSTRWDEDNAACCCAGENYLHEYRPEVFTNWWIKKHGVEAYDRLILKSHTPFKFSTVDISTIAIYYKQKYDEISKNT